MPPTGRETLKDVVWAHRVNTRWIVHHGLKEAAEAYLAHLEFSDPGRLGRFCKRAHQLVRACVPGDDPKPWFCAGLFSPASVAEAEQYMAGYRFTAVCVPSLAATVAADSAPDHIGPGTLEKMGCIRRALTSLQQSGCRPITPASSLRVQSRQTLPN